MTRDCRECEVRDLCLAYDRLFDARDNVLSAVGLAVIAKSAEANYKKTDAAKADVWDVLCRAVADHCPVYRVGE